MHLSAYVQAIFDLQNGPIKTQPVEAGGSKTLSFNQMVEGSEIYNKVKNYRTVGLSDNSNRFNNVIIPSRLSLEYPQFALPILGHEIGHLVFNYIEKNNLMDEVPSIKCVDTRNQFKAMKANSKNFYLNEDWSDNFSSRIVEKVIANSKYKSFYSKNMSCSLLNYSDINVFYLNKLEPDTNDPHSSPLYRLLLTAADRGINTTECKALIPDMPRCM